MAELAHPARTHHQIRPRQHVPHAEVVPITTRPIAARHHVDPAEHQQPLLERLERRQDPPRIRRIIEHEILFAPHRRPAILDRAIRREHHQEARRRISLGRVAAPAAEHRLEHG